MQRRAQPCGAADMGRDERSKLWLRGPDRPLARPAWSRLPTPEVLARARASTTITHPVG